MLIQVQMDTVNFAGGRNRDGFKERTARLVGNVLDGRGETDRLVLRPKNSSALIYQHLITDSRCCNVFVSCLNLGLQFAESFESAV